MAKGPLGLNTRLQLPSHRSSTQHTRTRRCPTCSCAETKTHATRLVSRHLGCPRAGMRAFHGGPRVQEAPWMVPALSGRKGEGHADPTQTANPVSLPGTWKMWAEALTSQTRGRWQKIKLHSLSFATALPPGSVKTSLFLSERLRISNTKKKGKEFSANRKIKWKVWGCCGLQNETGSHSLSPSHRWPSSTSV